MSKKGLGVSVGGYIGEALFEAKRMKNENKK